MNDDPGPGDAFDAHLGEYADTTPAEGFRVHFLDVGQGQSTLVRASNGETLLYDGGPSRAFDNELGPHGEQTVLRALDCLGVDRVDHLVLGHYHTDHVGGLSRVLESAADVDELGDVEERTRRRVEEAPDVVDEVGAVYGPDPAFADRKRTSVVDRFEAAAAAAGHSVEPLRAGDWFDLGSTTARALNPWDWDGVRPCDHNQNSVVLHLDESGTDRSALLTGDLCGEAEAQVAANYPRLLAGVDLLDAPYHGSVRSTGDVVEVTDPAVAVFSSSPDAKPGHPHDQTLSHYEAVGVGDTLATGVHGTVTAELIDEGVYLAHARTVEAESLPERSADPHDPEVIRREIRDGFVPEYLRLEESVAARLQPGAAPELPGRDDADTLVDAIAADAIRSGRLSPIRTARAADQGVIAARLADLLTAAAVETGLEDDTESPGLADAHPRIAEAAAESGRLYDLLDNLPGEPPVEDSRGGLSGRLTRRLAGGRLDGLLGDRLPSATDVDDPAGVVADQLVEAAEAGELDGLFDTRAAGERDADDPDRGPGVA